MTGLWSIGTIASGAGGRYGRFRQSDVLRQVFEATVARCITAGLVGGQGFAIDASLIQADANKQRSVPGDEWRIDDIPADPGQAVRDYLATLDDAAFGAATEVTPKFVSPSDPAAFFAYATNYLVDTENAIIVDVEATRAIRTAEVGAARTMIDRTEERFGLKPQRLAGDSAYGSAPMLAWLVKERQIAPHTGRRRQKRSSQWTRGRSCTKNHVGPLSGGSPLGRRHSRDFMPLSTPPDVARLFRSRPHLPFALDRE